MQLLFLLWKCKWLINVYVFPRGEDVKMNQSHKLKDKKSGRILSLSGEQIDCLGEFILSSPPTTDTLS